MNPHDKFTIKIDEEEHDELEMSIIGAVGRARFAVRYDNTDARRTTLRALRGLRRVVGHTNNSRFDDHVAFDATGLEVALIVTTLDGCIANAEGNRNSDQVQFLSDIKATILNQTVGTR